MAALYKWVDERGVTQYSETPPGQGKKAQTLNVPSGTSSANDITKNIQEQERAFRERRVDRSQAEREQEEKKAKEKEIAIRRQIRCDDARRDLRELNKQQPVYHLNEKGERIYVDDSDRPAMIKAAQKIIDENCTK